MTEDVKKSNHVQRKIEKRQQDRKIDPHIEEQFGGGRLLAAISSRPGQCGRADGYVFCSAFSSVSCITLKAKDLCLNFEPVSIILLYCVNL